ncbi:MAG TPA: DUF362 domain-containing protein [Chloroflexi bacterium]|nr:DUF362 domain-containing protein [Chloroflexota bacterium]
MSSGDCSETQERAIPSEEGALSDDRTTIALRRWTVFEDLDAVLARCLDDLGGIGRYVRPGQTVVIKPNITADMPACTGGTTHVEIAEALVGQLRLAGAGRIIVAEGTGRFGTSHETAFLHNGWREMAARTGIELYNLDAGPHRTVDLPDRRYTGELPISELVLDADVLISIPCLKTHVSTDYTVALKNSFALTPQATRSEIHRASMIEEALVDINRIRPPDLVVVDGWDGAEGIAGGTNFDRPARARLMLVGGDAVAVDLIARELMRFDAPTRYLTWAAESGIGIGDRSRIDVLGDDVSACSRRFMTAGDELCLMVPGLTLCDRKACSGCRTTATSVVRRFSLQKLNRPLEVIYGGEGAVPTVNGKALVVGDCARDCAHLGAHVAGCPPTMAALAAALEEMDIVCLECRDVARRVMDDLPVSLGAHLRVAAAGAEVFAGTQVVPDEWHRTLIVGDCSDRYVGVVCERATQFGLDPERDVIWVQGCPATEEAVRDALLRWQAEGAPGAL